MKFLKIALAATALTGFAASAQAQDSGVYINAGVDAVEFDSYNLSGKVGYQFNSFLSVEGQAAFGIIDDEVDGVDIGVDSSFGAFGKASLPVSDAAELFVRAGYAFTEVSASDGSVSVGVDADGFAGGVGGQYMFDANNGVRLEYTYYDLNFDIDGADDDDLDAGGDVFSLSYVRKF